KYHLGTSSDREFDGNSVHLSLTANPSHLEAVNPVVLGKARAKQSQIGDDVGGQVMPLLLHGDAAFAGQGIVAECFGLSELKGYRTSGTIHFVVNNQIGFTTSPKYSRSSPYPSDVGKIVQAPIFHVNGDDPEAVLFVTQMAIDFRTQFKKDVVIDIICYRSRGHNEADEPSITQPMMYQVIRKKKSPRQIYAAQLVSEGSMTQEETDEVVEEYRNALDDGMHVAKSLVKEPSIELFVDWSPYIGHEWSPFFNTSIPLKNLQAIAKKLAEIPKDFTLQRQVKRVMDDRAKMAAGDIPVDWGFAETLAYGSILTSGNKIRITGQDVGRGTFSHRHAVLFDQKTGDAHIPLQSLVEEENGFLIYDSLLSEVAVLAFEYGYATTMPNALVVWEAQFGDFANSAQVVIDQFITSGEHKWQRLCGLTLLLPHGYEGQGPEHSSARLERFLQLCAEHNIQVCLPTTSAQVFHMLRKQVLCPLRKPLIVMSPKSLLRHKETVSSLQEMAEGSFQVVLDETDGFEAEKVRKLVVCSGRVYYDLRAARRERKIDDIAIIRLEQLYPFPQEDFTKCLLQYKNLTSIAWCQEEPMNQGAWYSSQHHLRRPIQEHFPSVYLEYVGREASAAAAAGYPALHLSQLNEFIDHALS
ncbi:MAG: 2-oxoglutarate dehydrogenase E1 component, partial [Gammaproteobacteria bacterium]|nr:2-oxoglutarate dehydrogenase E1 component [Gammaproteobacteria bacterium]